jgi:Skp family chaperone for outer membrane proteins
LQELLTNQGIPRQLAERLAAQKAPEDVAKVLLNALYLQSQGKLQNGPGYIRAGLEAGYDLLPQVANRLESRRRELEARLRKIDEHRERLRRESERAAEEAAINLVIEQLRPEDLQELVRRAVESLPEPIVRRNPTLSNPFVRGKVYELACGEPLS